MSVQVNYKYFHLVCAGLSISRESDFTSEICVSWSSDTFGLFDHCDYVDDCDLILIVGAISIVTVST